jgi:3',5'-cyclic AMP phosphodiesterase CpdA
MAQVTLADPAPDFVLSAQNVKAITKKMVSRHAEEPRVAAFYHAAIFTGLKPGALYIYRVGDGENWSEWLQFRTAAKREEEISFIYFGDAQNNIKSMWSRVIRQAYATRPDADFILYAGDLINRSGSDREWAEWFYGGSFIHAMIPSVMTPGNHEYGRGDELDPHWRMQFNLPENGPDGLDEVCYVVDYQDLRIISLDTEMIDEIEKYEKTQKEWLESVLADNPQKWTVVTFHHPIFSTKPNRDNERLRALYRPILEKHGVDLVLQGHDHAYGRGRKNIESAVAEGQSSGTMYVVSVSGPKMYDLSDRSWMTRRARMTQMYQIVTITGDTLNFKAYTAAGELYDEFDLVKRLNSKNELIDKRPDTPDRL